MTVTDPAASPPRPGTGGDRSAHETVPLEVLEEIQWRVLWLAVRMVDHANRHDAGGIKVGGHQASSASMVSVMTALWFGHIGGQDKVAVKPHAAPVYHAIKYLTGELDRSYLLRLRELGGLQAYPSRTKDPDVADFSTGSVGLGAVAPLFSALARRYVDARFGPRPPARFYALVGDAELDEGNVWEAIADPATDGLGNVGLVVDLNRQSLDRVVPAIQARRLEGFFADAGWHVVEAKYGRRLQTAFAEPGGEALQRLIDDMPNEQYQALFRLRGPELRAAVTRDADPAAVRLLDRRSDEELAELIFDLGGHDLAVLLDAYRRADAVTDRPSVVFAYTIKGWGLPIAGDPLNHAALLTPDQIDELRARVGLTPETEWDRFDPDSPAGRWCAAVGGEINNEPPPPRPAVPVPVETGAGRPGRRRVSTQETFGRVLTALADVDEVARRLVTTSPDVSISTNLGGWINKTGVFHPVPVDDHGAADSVLRWAPSPEGHHIELGISEMNLFL
ncbi:MAG: pyruvate dehydrogenase, partial [Actinomyces sp.]